MVFVILLTLWTAFGIGLVQKWAEQRDVEKKREAESA
jgi:hypothetical protein